MSNTPPRAAAHAIETERTNTRRAQANAADPSSSAWVSANAGTGKTHVLTTRVLRLLVAGTKPERLLCLTYTKAAAAEMSERVFDRLAQWATADDSKLSSALSDLLMRPPAPAEMARARDLFTIAIETPGGLKVQTIHAFAERLLQRFPLEAGIPPKFAILDDETAAELRREAIEYVLTEAAREAKSPLGQALSTVIAWAVDDGFDALLADALTKRDWIETAIRLDRGQTPNDELAAAEHFYRKVLGLHGTSALEETEKALAQVLPDAELELACRTLNSGSANDKKMAERLAKARNAPSASFRIDALALAFLTTEGEPRKSMMTQATGKAHPDVDAVLTRAQDRFVRAFEQRGKLVVLGATMSLMRIAVAVHQHYRDLKQRRAALDFDDLIRHTANLLSTSGQAQWVLYKLDGGLDHILVDEAQDTSPLQWTIVHALASEFFAGDGATAAGARTLFAVGDEKQSIYGFQGAAPEEFARMGDTFENLALDARQSWRRVPLTLSFRSAAPVLEAVDRVFANPDLAKTITTSSDAIHHAANRIGAAGLVEIWDTETPDDDAPSEVWSPLDDTTTSSPVVRLADRIATTIDRWIGNGEILASEGRPIRAGDIVVLVRKRRPFAEAMVAALKARKIPVAGADRIRLADQIAMQDLLALADFLLLPEDDLALANVLKSPLFDLTDDDLLNLAPSRPRTLWSALLRHAEKSPRFAEAATLLKRWRSRSDLHPPYEFFVEVLDRDGMRHRLLTRLGSEAADPIDEFMRLALTFDDNEPPSLQGFVAALRRSNREIKRDMEHGRNEVRVMTVHGAKGLEAPIVFLPDTCSTSSGARPGGLLSFKVDAASFPVGAGDPFLWPVKGSKAVDAVRDARNALEQHEGAERNRLLYVALTRARDRLYVAGFEGAKGRERNCWYDMIEQSLSSVVTEHHDEQGRRVRRLQSQQTASPESPRHAGHAIIEAQPLPAWATRPAPREPGLVVPLAPSRLAPLETDAEGDPVERKPVDREATREPAALPPAAQADGHRFLRGTLTHALLEHLPTLDPATWEQAAITFVEARGSDLRPRTRKSIVSESLAVLRDTAFAPIFGRGSRAEVPVVAELQPPIATKGQILRVTGQIDRLVELDHEVLIVDYKTNRPPPLHAEAVAEVYLLQLAAYRLAIGQIFQGKRVRAALLWTDGPRLMVMPDAMLDAAEQRLFMLDRASLDAP